MNFQIITHIVIILQLYVLSVTAKINVNNTEVMKRLSYSFGLTLLECNDMLKLGDHILTDLYHFWKEDTELAHRDTGCAIVCMSKKLDLLDSTGKLHHGNAQEFAVKSGAGEEVASKLVTMVHACEQQHAVEEDACARALRVAACFRSGLRALGWAPRVEVAVGEVLTEI